MNGTTILKNVSFSGNTVIVGTGANNGSAAAKDVFICTPDIHNTAALCGAVVSRSGSTNTIEIVGTFTSLPSVSNVIFSGTLQQSETLTGSYTYADDDGNTESGSTYQWYRSDDVSGTNKVAISGATDKTYSLTGDDAGKFISFEVTPVNDIVSGLAVESNINSVAVVAVATDYEVTESTDDGLGSTANTLSWAILQANTHPGADTITVKTDVTVTGVMKRLLNSDITLQNDGSARSISGGDTYRPLFVKSGNITIQNLTLKNGKAKGGDSKNGGGGAGLGGALFIYNGTVTVDTVTFSDNNAAGGSGSIGGISEGGGGLFGNSGGNDSHSGDSGSGSGGGGGLFSHHHNNNGNGAYGGFGNYRGSNNDNFGQGGNFNRNTNADDGGFGGGGGASYYGDGGNGGFGGGGGYSAYGSNGNRGFGGGNGGKSVDGDGGSGFGGAIFAMNGTTTLKNVSFSGNSVVAGTGVANGTASAKDVFICTDGSNGTLTHDPLCNALVSTSSTTNTTEVTGFFDHLPSATNVSFSGAFIDGETLTGSYTYTDVDSDIEGGSTYQWYRSDDAGGSGRTAIAGATQQTYTLTSDDIGKFMSFEVTPVNAKNSGEAAESSLHNTAVTAINTAPNITTTAGTSATEDVEYSYVPTATDAENNGLVWTISSEPDGMTMDAATGAISWTPNEGVTSSGAVTITVTDDGAPNKTDSETFTIAVVSVNDAPVITSTAGTTATEDVGYSYAPTATDAENNNLVWAISGVPEGMTMDATTGAISWTPKEGVTSSGAVTITVTDDGIPNKTDTETFTVAVTSVNDAPVITSTAGATAIEDAEYSYAPTATDAENNDLVWTISGEPDGMTINAATGEVSWVPTGGITSSGIVTITVTDNGTGALTDSQTFSITVNADNNNDGIADDLQSNVITVNGQIAGSSFTIDVTQSPLCTQIDNVSTTVEGALGNGTDPGNFDYPIGLVNFTLTCSEADVVLYFRGLTSSPEHVRKYGFTNTSPNTRVWYQMPGVAFDQQTIAGQTVYTASYTLTDGELGDDDNQQNGVIVDPIGPVFAAPVVPGTTSPASIPTLSEWTKYLLILLMGLLGTKGQSWLEKSYRVTIKKQM